MTNRRHPFEVVSEHYAIREGFRLDRCNLCQERREFPYRLGDMIVNKEYRAIDLGPTVDNYPGSIVAEYASRTDKSENYEVLADIVKKRGSNLLKDLDTCVLHLRVGDVIDSVIDAGHSIEEIVKERISTNGLHWGHYTPSLSDILEGLDKISDTKDVTIVAGTHLTCNKDNSCKYIEAIEEGLRENGYKVSLRLGEKPDDDYVLMCLARNFVSSGGNYSLSIIKIREILESGASYNTRDKKTSTK